jgi:hypothetical protein
MNFFSNFFLGDSARIRELQKQLILVRQSLDSQIEINNNLITSIKSINSTTSNLQAAVQNLQNYVSAGPRVHPSSNP